MSCKLYDNNLLPLDSETFVLEHTAVVFLGRNWKQLIFNKNI